MKKFISVLLLVLLVSAFAGMAVSADAINTYLKGDTDGDGIVTIIDATTIQRILVDLQNDEDGMMTLRGNVHGDDLDILDATFIQRFLVDYDDGYGINTLVAYEPATEEPTIAPATDGPTTVPTEPETQTMTKDPNELPYVPANGN